MGLVLGSMPAVAAEKQKAEMDPAALFQAVSPCVVGVEVLDGQSKLLKQGSGFFISADGLVVTSWHVVAGGRTARVVLADGGNVPVLGLAAEDKEGDLALLKVGGTGRPYLRLAADMPPVGAKVFAVGNPAGLTNTLSEGLISGHRKLDTGISLLQTTAAISPGSSGGPLVSPEGKVVGVTTAYLVGGQNLNFAVPADRVVALTPSRDQLAALPARAPDKAQTARPEAEIQPKEGPRAQPEAERQEAERQEALRARAETKRRDYVLKLDGMIVTQNLRGAAAAPGYNDSIQQWRARADVCVAAYDRCLDLCREKLGIARRYPELGIDEAAVRDFMVRVKWRRDYVAANRP